MKNRIVALFIVALISITLVGCNSREAATEQTQKPIEDVVPEASQDTPTLSEEDIKALGKPMELIPQKPFTEEEQKRLVVLPCGKYFTTTFAQDGLRLMFLYQMTERSAGVGNFRPSKFRVSVVEGLKTPQVFMKNPQLEGGIHIALSMSDLEDAPCLLMLDELEQMKPGDPKPKAPAAPKIQA